LTTGSIHSSITVAGNSNLHVLAAQASTTLKARTSKGVRANKALHLKPPPGSEDPVSRFFWTVL
jgi:hypothetical protein